MGKESTRRMKKNPEEGVNESGLRRRARPLSGHIDSATGKKRSIGMALNQAKLRQRDDGRWPVGKSMIAYVSIRLRLGSHVICANHDMSGEVIKVNVAY
jgi:hypothetical protein